MNTTACGSFESVRVCYATVHIPRSVETHKAKPGGVSQDLAGGIKSTFLIIIIIITLFILLIIPSAILLVLTGEQCL